MACTSNSTAINVAIYDWKSQGELTFEKDKLEYNG